MYCVYLIELPTGNNFAPRIFVFMAIFDAVVVTLLIIAAPFETKRLSRANANYGRAVTFEAIVLGSAMAIATGFNIWMAKGEV